MNIVFYTNCQWRGIKPYLEKVYPEANFCILENYEMINEKRKINYEILKKADIFIFQHIGKQHGLYSTNKDISGNILSYLREECVKISFPYIYNNSFWILIPPSHGDDFIGEVGNMNKYINIEPIKNLKKKGVSLADTLKLYKEGKIDFDFENRFNKSLEILKEKEKICDITVSDFIKENYKKHILFFTQNHPSTCIFVHVVNKILKLLNIDKEFDLFPEDINITKLPIFWHNTDYDIKFFEKKIDKFYNNEWYIKHIKFIYTKC